MQKESTTTLYITEYEPLSDSSNPSSQNTLCECGEHYISDQLRQSTPPLNIHEMFATLEIENPHEKHTANITEFTRHFENVYAVTYTQFETDWPAALILWSDTTLFDFSFVSLDVAGHY